MKRICEICHKRIWWWQQARIHWFPNDPHEHLHCWHKGYQEREAERKKEEEKRQRIDLIKQAIRELEQEKYKQ